MPSKKYYLDKEKKDALELKWGYNWKNFIVTHKGEEIAHYANKKELLEGKSFSITDGREISIKLKNNFSNELEILVNGEILAGSPSDPKIIIKTAFIISLVIGGLSIVLGLLGLFTNSSILQALGAGTIMLIFGIVITALSFGIRAKSMIALVLVNILYIADTLLWIYMIVESGGNAPTAGIVLRVLFIFALVRAIPAMKKIKA